MLDFGSKGGEFEAHWMHCVASLSTTPSAKYWFKPEQNVDWDVKPQHKQKTVNMVVTTSSLYHESFGFVL